MFSHGSVLVTQALVFSVLSNAAARRAVIASLGWTLLIVAGWVGTMMVVVGLFEDLSAMIHRSSDKRR
jgi:hypothetical protein